ncbi:hypothetical protein Tco_1474678, partial [Tanacetum coccineum]
HPNVTIPLLPDFGGVTRRLPLEYIRLGNVLKVPDIVARCFGMDKDPHLLLEGQGLNITYVVQALSHIAQNCCHGLF